MTEKPILFSGQMVRAILDGRKTMTRRVVKPQPSSNINPVYLEDCQQWQWASVASRRACPYGVPGDRLWVRESGWERPERTDYEMREGADTWPPYLYDADDLDHELVAEWGWKRRPSIFMPRWASRITLEVTAVRVERLQEITEADAKAEGVWLDGFHEDSFVTQFRLLWDDLNGLRGFGWSVNPWVLVVSFRRADK